MQINPNISLKTDELLMKWFTDPFINETHKDIIKRIKQDVNIKAKSFSNLSYIPSTRCSTNHYKYLNFTCNNPLPRSYTPPTFQGSPKKSHKPQMHLKSTELSGDNRSGVIVKPEKSITRDLKNYSVDSINSIPTKDVSHLTPKQSDSVSLKSHTNIKKSLSTSDKPNSIINVNRADSLPKFFFPKGKPRSSEEIKTQIKQMHEKLKALEVRNNSSIDLIHKSKMDEVVKILKIPLYWKQLVFIGAGGTDSNFYISKENIINMWEKIILSNYNEASQFFALITQNKKNFIEPQDFYPLVQDVLESHPGLTFLLSARDFHSRYIATVVYRIFYVVNTTWSGKITLQELSRSDLLQIISSLEHNDDINTITQYFSYEHFYVIYCKFWELDEDHDLVISKADLARHNNYAISERMVERIFSGAVTKSRARSEGLMTYTEFVWFLMAEEDKRHHRSIEYWFRCMDLDGDGILSLYELEYFYQEQLFRMEEMGIEPISFEDCICQMLDMIKPKEPNKIRLADLKNCRLVHIFFDTFFNLTKYLEHEQRDPFTNLKDLEEGLNEMSDWDRYAAEAYEVLVAEDGSQENYNDNYRETNNSYRGSNNEPGTTNNEEDEEAVYENIIVTPGSVNTHPTAATIVSTVASTSPLSTSTANTSTSPNKVAVNQKKKTTPSPSPGYNEYVNGKLAEFTDVNSTN